MDFEHARQLISNTVADLSGCVAAIAFAKDDALKASTNLRALAAAGFRSPAVTSLQAQIAKLQDDLADISDDAHGAHKRAERL
jgi:hypothetical protein